MAMVSDMGYYFDMTSIGVDIEIDSYIDSSQLSQSAHLLVLDIPEPQDQDQD